MYKDRSKRPIAVFDSGFGGISVLNRLREFLPNEDFIFFGDSLNAPYGEKSMEEIRMLSFNVYKKLKERDVKAVVIACNTATCASVEYLRAIYKDDIIIGIEPAVKSAALYSGKDKPSILVMATEFTLNSERFYRLKNRFSPAASIYSLPAPGIVRNVEAGNNEGPEIDKYLNELLMPYRKGNNSSYIHLDSIVLGCTHFPFAREAIKKSIDYNLKFFEGSVGIAKETKRRLKSEDLLNKSLTNGTCYIYNSLPDPNRKTFVMKYIDSKINLKFLDEI